MVEPIIKPEKIIGVLNGKYRFMRLIGEGSSSRVYLAFTIPDEYPVAVKIFKSEFLNSSPEAKEIYLSEVDILLKLNHPNIIKMYEYGINGRIVGDRVDLPDLWFLVLEYISECTLITLVKFNDRLSEENAKYFFYQMISTLKYIND